MQTIYVTDVTYRRNVRDVMGYYDYQYKTNPHYRVADTEKRVDILVNSLHATKPRTIAGHADVEVISYVPQLDDPDWPEFYTRLCLSKIIAADSFVLEKLKSLAFPDKRIINLDGTYVPVKPSTLNVQKTKDIRIGHLGPHKLWNQYYSWLTSANQDENPAKFSPVDDASMAQVLISFDQVGTLLGNAVSRQAHYTWIGFHPISSLYLDARFTHSYNKQFSQAQATPGGAGSKMLKDAFEIFTQELANLYVHSAIVPVPTYESNVDIVDRIVNELNRT